MEIEIQSQTNNPLLNRTEVKFLIHHENDGTPKRDLIRDELAEKLKAKKEHIIINYLKSGFGVTQTRGYAKIYKSIDTMKAIEEEHILVRNAVIQKQKKKEEKPEKEQPKQKSTEEKKEEQPPEKPPSEEKPEKETQEENAPPEPQEPPAEEKKEEGAEHNTEEKKE